MKNTAKMRFLAILLCSALLLGLLPVSVWAATEISSVAITNVQLPATGDKVPASATVSTSGVQFFSMDWYDKTAGRFLETNDHFVEDHIYEVQIWVEAKSGYEFRTNGVSPSVTATVNGKTATVSKAYEYQAWAMVVVSYTFEPCADKTIRSVNIELDGLTKNGNVLLAQEGGNIPFTMFSVSDDIAVYPELNTNRYYPYGFRWSNITKDTLAYSGDRFKGGCDYYVTIAIKPVSCTFTDDLSVTINGKKATLRAKGSTYAEASVEVTCYGNIIGGMINPVVMLPRAGNNPDYGNPFISLSEIEYVYVPNWYDVETGNKLRSNDTFVGGKQYRVEITCDAAYAYQFAKNSSGELTSLPTITGQTVDSYSFGYNSQRGRESITLVKTFTATGSSSQSTEPQHTHSPSGWRTTGTYHYKTCNSCGEFLEQEDHKGGVATCKEKGKCTVCDYAYLSENENHTPDTSKWTACGSLYHAHLCKDCGAHCDAQEHIAGPAGTPDTAVVCKDCGYIITPAKNHEHRLTKVAKKDATCIEPDFFADSEAKTKINDTAIAPLGHKTSDDWKYDENNHWRICTVCNELLTETQMGHEMNGEKCATCNYDGTIPEKTPDTEAGTEPADPSAAPTDSPSPDEDSDGLPWWALLLVGLAAVVVGVGIGVLALNKKKKEK